MDNSNFLIGVIIFLFLFIAVGLKRYFKILFDLDAYKEAVRTLTEEKEAAVKHANLLEGQTHMHYVDQLAAERMNNELKMRRAAMQALEREKAALLIHIQKQDQWIKNLEIQLAKALKLTPTAPTAVNQFTKDEIKTLISLCHPDKHGGKESATRITQKLITMR